MSKANNSVLDDFWAMLLPENHEYDSVTEEDFAPERHESLIPRIGALALIVLCCIAPSVAGWAVRDSAAARRVAAKEAARRSRTRSSEQGKKRFWCATSLPGSGSSDTSSTRR